MANPKRLTLVNNVFYLHMDDGKKLRAIPSPQAVWYFKGGATNPGDGGGGTPDPGNGLFRSPFGYETGKVSSPYGPRTGGAGTFHEGIDWGAGANGGVGAPIYAAGDGTVIYSDEDGGFGNMVIIDHGVIPTGTHAGKRAWTLYAHMVGFPLVGLGPVTKGTQLGGIGDTGSYSQGAHLHHEVHINVPDGGIVHNLANNGGFRSAVDPAIFYSEYGVAA